MGEKGSIGEDASAIGASAEQQQQKKVVVSTDAFNLAKGWLRNMTGGADFDPDKEEEDALRQPETRPARLGLGAKFLPHSQATIATPVMKKLKRQIDKSAAQNHQEEVATPADGDEESDDEESRSSAFKAKKSGSSKGIK